MASLQDRESNEQKGDAHCDEHKTTQVHDTSLGENLGTCDAIELVIRIRVVKVVVLFNIFGKQQQASGW